MDADAIKKARQILRQVQEHLHDSHLNLGVRQEQIGFVDVMYHPRYQLASLNYVTPRRKTAWIPGDMVADGLKRLRALGRRPRVQYIEGLFPPLFAKSLREIGLQVERETPIMVYTVEDSGGAEKVTLPDTPADVHVELVYDRRGIEFWRYMWRNTFFNYDVPTFDVEPLLIPQVTANLAANRQFDVLLMQGEDTIGAARLSLLQTTGHIVALALREQYANDVLRCLLQAAATRSALERGCELVFAPGHSAKHRQQLRELGYKDYGSMVTYTTLGERKPEDTNGHLGQSVLSL